MARRERGDAERALSAVLPSTVRLTRRALRWTQRQLAERCDMTQSQVSRFESGQIDVVTLGEAGRLVDALGIRLELVVHRPFVAGAPVQRDAAHARCVAYVAGRLAAMGWDIRREVEISGGQSHGWIDVLAYHPARRALLVIEIKTVITDLGAAERQLGWYRRAAGAAARSFGWRVDATASALLVLATIQNEEMLGENRQSLAQAFPSRAAAFFGWLTEPRAPPPRPAMALFDPRTRRRQWLIPSALDGRRSALRHLDYADFMRQVRRSPASVRR
jgi:transcriptional regulator with XRE-family HTH domain